MAYENWQQYSSADPSEFAGMDDDYMLELAQNLVDVDISAEDLAKYMPKFDQRGLQNIRQEMRYTRQAYGEEIADIGQSKQGDLLQAAIDKSNAQRKGGFSSTGNPMLDRQRRNTYQDISQGQSRKYSDLEAEHWRGMEDQHQLKEDYQQAFGERLIDFETMREKEEAAANVDDRGFFTKLWDESIGVGGITGWVDDLFSGEQDWSGTGWWDNTMGKNGIGGGIGDFFESLSDVKLKENIELVGQSNSGINVYEFDYKNKAHGEGRFRGVMAQEVPWACSVNNNNQYTVDYSKVDVDFERI